MAYQLEFAEERSLFELWSHEATRHRGAAAEMRRAYDALIELAAVDGVATAPSVEEYHRYYIQAFQDYNRGDLQNAELLSRAVKHLCRAAWFDAKVHFLEAHSEDFPHVPGLITGGAQGIAAGVAEVESRLSRLKLTGLADRFGARARKLVERLESLPDLNRLVADTLMKAAWEYCLATESLHAIEFRAVA